MHLVLIMSKWISLIGFGAFIGAASFAIFPSFFWFMLSVGGGDAGAWLIGIVHLLVPGFLAATSLLALYVLRRYPMFYPLGALSVVALWGITLKVPPVAKFVFPLS
jgi:hypothetical protein